MQSCCCHSRSFNFFLCFSRRFLDICFPLGSFTSTVTRHSSVDILRTDVTILGHVSRSDDRMDHTGVLRSVIMGLPRYWMRPQVVRGRHGSTLLRKIGLNTAWRRAQDRIGVNQWKRRRRGMPPASDDDDDIFLRISAG